MDQIEIEGPSESGLFPFDRIAAGVTIAGSAVWTAWILWSSWSASRDSSSFSQATLFFRPASWSVVGALTAFAIQVWCGRGMAKSQGWAIILATAYAAHRLIGLSSSGLSLFSPGANSIPKWMTWSPLVLGIVDLTTLFIFFYGVLRIFKFLGPRPEEEPSVSPFIPDRVAGTALALVAVAIGLWDLWGLSQWTAHTSTGGLDAFDGWTHGFARYVGPVISGATEVWIAANVARSRVWAFVVLALTATPVWLNFLPASESRGPGLKSFVWLAAFLYIGLRLSAVIKPREETLEFDQ